MRSWFFLSSSAAKELLDAPLRLAQVLVDVSEAPGLSIKLRFELTDTSLHLDHGLPASLEGSHFSLISTGGGVLALGLKKLLVLLQVHGELLLTAELVGQTSGIHHGAGSLVLRQTGLIGHLVEVTIELGKLSLKLPLGGSDGLVDVGQISKSFISVSELLFSSPALAVSPMQESTSLLQTVGHGSGPPC